MTAAVDNRSKFVPHSQLLNYISIQTIQVKTIIAEEIQFYSPW